MYCVAHVFSRTIKVLRKLCLTCWQMHSPMSTRTLLGNAMPFCRARLHEQKPRAPGPLKYRDILPRYPYTFLTCVFFLFCHEQLYVTQPAEHGRSVRSVGSNCQHTIKIEKYIGSHNKEAPQPPTFPWLPRFSGKSGDPGAETREIREDCSTWAEDGPGKWLSWGMIP